MAQRHVSIIYSTGVTLAFLLAAQSASAQVVAPADQQAAVATQGDDQDIIVTAEKRPTERRDVPGGVSVLSSSALEDNRINNLEDATRLVPGFEFGKASGGQDAYPVIRGVGPQIIGDPTVSILLDGAGFANSPLAGSEEIFDASDIEILKGPQATLYGANSLGGVVNIVSKLPSLTRFEGDFRASYGDYDSALVRGAVSIPIINDKLAIRVGGYSDSRDGYYTNIFDGKKGQDAYREEGARLAVRFHPTEVFDSALVFTYSHTSSDCGDCSNPIIGYNAADPQSVGQRTINTNNLADYTDTNIPGSYSRNIYRATWNNTLDLGGVKLTSLTGYGKLSYATVTDADRGPGDTLALGGGLFVTDFQATNPTEVFNQELRLVSDGTGPLQWQVGGFFQRSTNHNILNLDTNLAGRLPGTNDRETFDNFAIFTQNKYQVNDRFSIEIGLRYDHAKKHNVNYAADLTLDTTSNAWLPKFSVLYKLDDYNNLYATISRGYKTGGVNSEPGVPTSYKPEYLWNYEAGLKGVSSDHRLRYELSGYYIDWTNQQVQETIGFYGYVANASSTHIYGAEASVHYDLTRRLTLDGTLSYNHSRYVNFFDGSGTPMFFGVDPDRSGERTFFSPDWSGSVAARYKQPIGGGYDVTLGGDARYTGKRALDASAVLIGNAYVLANFSISVGDNQKRLTVFANNAFDKRYSTADLLIVGVEPITHLGAPRVFGVQGDFRF